MTTDLLLTSDFNYTMTSSQIIHSCFDCNTVQMRLLLLAIGQTVRTSKNQLEISISDYCRIMNIDSSMGGHNRTTLIKNVKSCANLQIVIQTKKKGTFINWFSKADYTFEDKKIVFKFNPDVLPLVNALEKYTVIDTSLYSHLSAYACRFFLLLKSSRTEHQSVLARKNKTWSIDMTVDEIKHLFNIGKNTYSRASNLFNRVIKQPIDNLNAYNTEFHTTYKTIKNGRKIIAVKFTCTEIYSMKKISTHDSTEMKQEKKDINKGLKTLAKKKLQEEQQNINDLIEKYSEEWLGYYTDAYQKNETLPDRMRKIFSEKEANTKLLQSHC